MNVVSRSLPGLGGTRGGLSYPRSKLCAWLASASLGKGGKVNGAELTVGLSDVRDHFQAI